ncbi:MAG: T9SS type A sorting domain-containing protein [Hymenobacter sp.]|nr:T9SS type A sorting domain-containing protein [Hymenobacter sp.]
MRNALLLLLSLAALCPAHAQQRGCPDPRATNYNPAATINDGSCQYPPTATPLLTRAQLPAELAETSGLQLTSQGLWTVNDGGNSPVLFRVEPGSGSISQRIQIDNFSNVDWEDLAADAQYLYIGDFGNNSGSRTDLRVLRVLKTDIGGAAADTAAAQAIHFRYPDQTSFAPSLNNHNFDCEALFYFNDSLHLFTKNWADLRTRHYTVPAAPGTHVARLKASFNVNGLLTAASLNAAGTEACLLGYNASTGATFVWLLSDFVGTNYFQGNKRRIELPNALQIGQAEGLSFVDRYRLYLSNERLITSFVTVPPRLYELDTSPWLAAPLATDVPAPQRVSVQVFPAPAGQRLTVRRAAGLVGAVAVSLLDLRGQTLLSTSLKAGQSERIIPLAAVAAGVYVLKIRSMEGTFSRKIIIQ